MIVFTEKDLSELRRIIEHINISSLNKSMQHHLLIVSSPNTSVEKLIKTACEITNSYFYTPYVAKYFDAAGFEKSFFHALKKCVEFDNRKVIFVSDVSITDHVYADLINVFISCENERIII